MSKKWKALHKREFEEKMEPELREEENQLAQTDKKILRTELEYSARLKPHDSLAKSPSGRLAKYFSGEKGIFIPGQ